MAGAGTAANNIDKKVKFNCLSKINNTQIVNAKYIDIVMPLYDLIEYSDNYSKTSGGLMAIL